MGKTLTVTAMLKKTVKVDEKKTYELLMSKLQKEYYLCFVDYRDELPSGLIQKCINEKNLDPLYEEDVYDDAKRYYAVHEMESILNDNGYTPEQILLFRGSEEADDIIEEIMMRDESNPEGECLKKTGINGYIRFHSNYDCWLPIWEQGGIQAQGTALSDIMAALSLNPLKVKEAAREKGIKTIGAFRNCPKREGKEVVDYAQFIRVLIETPNYGNWSFFGRLDGSELYDAKCDIDRMVIPKGTTCAMFNWWNGGGSLDFCETLRDIDVSTLSKRLSRYKGDLKLIVDERENKDYGYTPGEVYGGSVSDDVLLKTR